MNPKNSHNNLPWYDSNWLKAYLTATQVIRERRPESLARFEQEMAVFRTPADFEPMVLDDVFDDETFSRIKKTASAYSLSTTEQHELKQFGRFVVHDDEFFTELQPSLVGRMSELVGEPLEVSYNFLSYYLGSGVCPLHLDAPRAKWTLDLCVDQSREWPIQISEVIDWPENSEADRDSAVWETNIKQSCRFESYSMTPGQALVFGGSGQWHYRDRMENASFGDYCTLLFFHFVPIGTQEILEPTNWAELFDVPELGVMFPPKRLAS